MKKIFITINCSHMRLILIIEYSLPLIEMIVKKLIHVMWHLMYM